MDVITMKALTLIISLLFLPGTTFALADFAQNLQKKEDPLVIIVLDTKKIDVTYNEDNGLLTACEVTDEYVSKINCFSGYDIDWVIEEITNSIVENERNYTFTAQTP